MKLHFRQRFFSWLDSYDVWDENDNVFCTVRGQLAWGHCLKLFGPDGRELGQVKERVLTLLPRFELTVQGRYAGCISREFTLFHPRYNIECSGWEVEGDLLEWDYVICDRNGQTVARVEKELLHFTDTYTIDVRSREEALLAVMLVLAIDAEKCSRRD